MKKDLEICIIINAVYDSNLSLENKYKITDILEELKESNEISIETYDCIMKKI